MRKIVAFSAIGIVAIVVITALVFQNMGITVNEYKVEKGLVQEYIEVDGIVDLENRKTVYSQIDGIIKNVLVKEGETVSIGQQLAEINGDDLSNSIKISRSTYNSSLAKHEDFINGIKPEQIKQAQAQLEQARLTLENAKQDYKYKKQQYEKGLELYKSNSITKSELDDKEMSATVSKNNLGIAEQSYKIAEYQLQALRNGSSGNALKASQASVEQAQLSLKNLEDKLPKLSVNSDINGVVLSKFIEAGSAVNLGLPLFELGDTGTAYVKVNILNDDIGKITIGQKAIISGGILDDKEVQGEVMYISPKAESSISSLGIERQQVMVKIKLNDNSMKLKPGYEFKVKIITKEKSSAIYVPKKSIFSRNKNNCIFVVRNGKLEIETIEKGIENKDFVEVKGGIKEGDIIVEELENNLREGLKVKSGVH